MFDKAGGRVLDRIESPRGPLEFNLRSALKMEHTVLEILDKLQDEARRPELKQQFAHHSDETRAQSENLEQWFASLGAEADEKPCPTVEAIDKESKTNVKIADERMVDAVILSGAAEHHEIVVYATLISHAHAMDEHDVVRRVRENLQQEEHMLEEVKHAMRKAAGELSHQAV
jgi:ferritin-like metal-binding protein YciE